MKTNLQSGGSYGNMVASAYGVASQQVKSKILNITVVGDKVQDFNFTNQKQHRPGSLGSHHGN